MKARFTFANKEGMLTMQHNVIVPQQNDDSLFSLIGFDDWEDTHTGKMKAAATNVDWFELETNGVGFGKN